MADIIVLTFDDALAIGRFGGDEFCVITDNVSRIELELKIEHVRERLAKVKQKNGWDDHVDVSCGYEIYNYTQNMSMQEFNEHIDSLMYSQKQEHHMIQSEE